jgi:PadR family transcriptional regulator, regulatory protein PadR
MPRITSDTLYGTLNLLILRVLQDGPLHGLAIQRRLRDASDSALSVEEGALYPALHRLEADGLLSAEWGTSEKNRKAKFYRLTAKGRRHLQREAAKWTAHAAAVFRTLGTEGTSR